MTKTRAISAPENSSQKQWFAATLSAICLICHRKFVTSATTRNSKAPSATWECKAPPGRTSEPTTQLCAERTPRNVASHQASARRLYLGHDIACTVGHRIRNANCPQTPQCRHLPLSPAGHHTSVPSDGGPRSSQRPRPISHLQPPRHRYAHLSGLRQEAINRSNSRPRRRRRSPETRLHPGECPAAGRNRRTAWSVALRWS